MSLAVSSPVQVSEFRSKHRHTTLLAGIGTALPRYSATQDEARQFMENVLVASGGVSSAQLALQRRIYMKSGIHRRQSVLQDYIRSNPAENLFFPANAALEPFPSTALRMEVYERESVPLAVAAAKCALKNAGISASRVTHIVVSTCTGFFAPGLDVMLIRELGLKTTVRRTMLGFMGCYAGVSGIQLSHHLVQSDPDTVVLQVAVELCSLHFQKDLSPDTMVANAIFSDGAAAAVYMSDAGGSPTNPVEVLAARTDVAPDSLGGMSWRIGDTGFVMRLDSQVPALLQESASGFVETMLASVGFSRDQVSAWAVHPGGRRILETVGESLALTGAELDSSYSVLRDHGNMSSATIFFVLQRELENAEKKGVLAALAFGPGLTTEGVLLSLG